jgi:hypothetical protein
MCLATVMLWMRSYWYFDIWRAVCLADRDTALVDWQLQVGPFHGISYVKVFQSFRVRIALGESYKPYAGFPVYERQHEGDRVPFNGIGPDRRAIGFDCHRERMVMSGGTLCTSVFVLIPYWSIALALGICPLWMIVRFARKPRYNHCSTCSYNLTGNTSGICPECGTAVEIAPVPQN